MQQLSNYETCNTVGLPSPPADPNMDHTVFIPDNYLLVSKELILIIYIYISPVIIISDNNLFTINFSHDCCLLSRLLKPDSYA